MPKMARQTATPVEHPWDVWQARLEPLMYIYSLSPLFAPVHGQPPFGLDFDGVLKPPESAANDRTVRQHYLDTFEQLLGVIAESGAQCRAHPVFELCGQVRHAPVYFGTGKPVEPDQLVTECRVKFQLLLDP